jgi:hypothetical protein
VRVLRFKLDKIAKIEGLELFMGEFELAIGRDDGITANVARITVRTSASKASTFSEIQDALFAEARGHVKQAAQLFAQESVESLYQAAKDTQEEQQQARERAMQEALETP